MMEGKKLNLVGRILLSLGVVLSGTNAKAEYYRIDCKSVEANSPWAAVAHLNGAVEGHDSKDVDFLQSPHNPRIDFYSKVPLFYPYEDKLKVDARGPTSTTYFDIKIEGAEILGSIDADLNFQILDDGQGNFSWKNIIGELYNNGDVNDSNNLLGVYDMKHMDKIDAKIPLTINNGLSYQLLVKFFNHADFNRDRHIDGLDFEIFANEFGKSNTTDPNIFPGDLNDDGRVNLKDFSYFAANWNSTDVNSIANINKDEIVDYKDLGAFVNDYLKINRFGKYVGADVNDLGAYADIDRNGSVDVNDLDIFKTYFKFPGDIGLDGKVGLPDFAYLSADWNATDVNSIADISGPNGIPDKNVDYWDLSAFTGDYLRDINDPNTWSRVR